ncbi:MAG: hypothetical protein Q8R32_02380 [bacterium]|nr:hypothetical protein [bacterium]
MLKKFFTRGGASLAALALLAPATAFAAGAATAAVAVDQRTWVTSNNGFDVAQSADVSVGTSLGNVLTANSQSQGSQWVWAQGMTDMSQKLAAGATILWDTAGNAWSKTAGSVNQAMNTWSGPAAAHTIQTAGIWQHGNVGPTVSTADGTIRQESVGVVGDVIQKQAIAGSTQTDGRIIPPRPAFHPDFGGRLDVAVDVFVRTFLTF